MRGSYVPISSRTLKIMNQLVDMRKHATRSLKTILMNLIVASLPQIMASRGPENLPIFIIIPPHVMLHVTMDTLFEITRKKRARLLV